MISFQQTGEAFSPVCFNSGRLFVIFVAGRIIFVLFENFTGICGIIKVFTTIEEMNSMNDYNFLIYDDSKEDCKALKTLLQEEAAEREVRIFTAYTLTEARKLLDKNISAVFLDIELETPNNGIEFAGYIRENYPHIRIVFITAHIWYSEEICPVKPDGFMVKPFTAEKVKRVFDYLRTLLTDSSSDFILAKVSKHNVVRIFLKQIAYIETCGRKQLFYNQNNQKIFTVCEKLSDLEERLPAYFIRCHHSFCINLNYTSDVERYLVLLSSGATIPVSQQKYKYTKQSFVGFLGRDI